MIGTPYNVIDAENVCGLAGVVARRVQPFDDFAEIQKCLEHHLLAVGWNDKSATRRHRLEFPAQAFLVRNYSHRNSSFSPYHRMACIIIASRLSAGERQHCMAVMAKEEADEKKGPESALPSHLPDLSMSA
jgi:hypothetical protein